MLFRTTTSLFGKAREAILALKIDQSQSKEEILANYLNTIYFGRGAYGIEAAAQAYFGVPAKDLTLEQAALLTAVIPAPSAWDPAVNPEKARQRYTRVLKLMAEDEWIKPAERDQALAIFPDTIKQKTANTLAGTNGYLLQTVKAELLNQAGFTEDQVANGGYKIVSTFNKEKQDLLVQAVNALPQDRPANNRVGAYSMNPQNGEVYALYGGKDYLVQQQNDATQSRAQAGSTFKIFTLVGAIEKDVPMHQKFPAPGTMRVPGTDLEFSNDSLINYGALDLVGMTRTSANTPYINLNLEIGASTTAETAVKMGIPQDAPGLDANIGNVLGSTSVTAKQMAQAYGVVAAGGKLHQAHTVRTVENSSGANIYTGNTSGKQVIKQDTATLATHAFRSVVSSGSAVAKRIGVPKGREYAGKSGTSSGPVSGWFIGYTPQMVTAVNMFQSGENGAEEKLTPFGGVRTVYGVTFPLEIWWDYTKPALLNAERLKFPDPAKLLALQSPPPVAPKPSETEKPAEEQVEQPRGEQPGVEAPAGNSGTQSGQEGTTGNAPAPQPPADGGQPGVAGEPDPGAGVSEGE
ncbi:transglycosylase domain-containing protein [Arcanobacterium hippocoleae]|uniref:transglycosylase domain-containing protein n=1 Tax=Arcanobacterium hippocoleae TaxID=149017 RepID=UPI00333FEBFC